jgi:hypothetical protein
MPHLARADADAVGRALVTATSTGEQIVAEATAEAARLAEEAQAARERLERETDELREELEREREAERRRLAADRQDVMPANPRRGRAAAHGGARRGFAAPLRGGRPRRVRRGEAGAFVEAANAALAELERLGRPAGELVADLHPGGPSSADT